MRLQNVILIMSLAAVVVIFQNCGDEVSFTSDPGLTKVGTAGTLSDDGTNDEQVVDDGNEVDETDDVVDEDDVSDDEDSGELSDVANGLYVCILEGPGKSIKVGYRDEVLAAQNGTPQVVCMSEMACKNLISKKFDVKAVGKRGFCPNKNKHVVALSDKAISDLLK